MSLLAWFGCRSLGWVEGKPKRDLFSCSGRAGGGGRRNVGGFRLFGGCKMAPLCLRTSTFEDVGHSSLNRRNIIEEVLVSIDIEHECWVSKRD